MTLTMVSAEKITFEIKEEKIMKTQTLAVVMVLLVGILGVGGCASIIENKAIIKDRTVLFLLFSIVL